jgi:hypothetical protein
MALIRCGECGREISSKANACPGCGARKPKGNRWLLGIALFVVAFVSTGILVDGAAKRSERRAIEKCWADAMASVKTAWMPSKEKCLLMQDEFAARHGHQP